MSRNPKDAKPRLETVEGVQHLILHDLQEFHLCNRYKEMGSRGYDIEEFEIKFTVDEVRRARFSRNQGSMGGLRLALDRDGEKPEYWFLMEELDDIKAVVGFDLQYMEKWPQD